MKADVYSHITDQIIAALEAGTVPWIRPWSCGEASAMPHNAATERPYSGINVLLCWMAGYSSNAWLTYKQAQAMGGTVKKGEKGTALVFFKQLTVADKSNPDKTVNVPMLRQFTVFNAEQCEMPASDEPEPAEIAEPLSLAITDIACKKSAIVEHGGDRACYIPSADVVKMPHQHQFLTTDHYSATLAHELTHWTGSKKRLDRDLAGRFGSASYAAEELIAEMGAAFLCASLKIKNETLQHADYIASWIDVLKNDKKAIFTASSYARKAHEFLTA